MSRKRLIVIVAATAAAAAVAATVWFFVVLRGEERKAPIPPSRSAFQTLEIRGVDALNRPEASQRANEQGARIVVALNDMYTHAFLRPRRWAPPASPTPAAVEPEDRLAGFFSADARPTLDANIGALAIADLGRRFTRIDPTKQVISKISFQVEEDLSTPFAVATLGFEARGSTRVAAEGPVAISHTATYWFIDEGDAFRIYAYSAELKTDTVLKKAAFGVSEQTAT